MFSMFAIFTDFNLGKLSLNISFILYLVLYLPQILHNRKQQHIAELSHGLHYLLFFSYSCDLIYGVLSQFPWQYKIVSVVGLLLLTVQQWQLFVYTLRTKKLALLTINFSAFVANLAFVYAFLFLISAQISSQELLVIGSFARIFGLAASLPQIRRNRYAQSARALSPYYLYLNLILASLDTISAWCLHWGWPNQLASPLTVVLMLYSLWQIKRYTPLSIGRPQYDF